MLSEYHEVRFPLALAFGAIGGPERRTDIVELASGQEVRNAVWAGARRRWDIGSAVQSLDELNLLIGFFEARRGPLHGFRFRDFADDRSGLPEQPVSAMDQVLGEGDGVTTAFQLTKRYGETVRPILKPVDGTVVIAIDDTVQPSGYTVDLSTGRVEFDTAPAQGATITAGFEFDCPVRFDSDRIEASLEGFGAGRIVNAKLIELVG